MTTQRNSYSAEFKARVALEALKGHKTVNELASAYRVDQRAHLNRNRRFRMRPEV